MERPQDEKWGEEVRGNTGRLRSCQLDLKNKLLARLIMPVLFKWGFFFFWHRPDPIITVRRGRDGGIPLPLEPLWNGSNTHADRKNKHYRPEAARRSEHLKKKNRRDGGDRSTPSYYGNSHLRLTYVMVVVKTAAKWTRSRSAFGGLGSLPVPARPFAFPLMGLFLLRFFILPCAAECFFRVFLGGFCCFTWAAWVGRHYHSPQWQRHRQEMSQTPWQPLIEPLRN